MSNEKTCMHQQNPDKKNSFLTTEKWFVYRVALAVWPACDAVDRNYLHKVMLHDINWCSKMEQMYFYPQSNGN